jgi:hypothetical protein
MRPVSLKPASPELDHWAIIFPKRHQWPNYTSKFLLTAQLFHGYHHPNQVKYDWN